MVTVTVEAGGNGGPTDSRVQSPSCPSSSAPPPRSAPRSINFDAPSPAHSSFSDAALSLLWDPLPDSPRRLSSQRTEAEPEMPQAQPGLNVAVNRALLFKALDAEIDAIVRAGGGGGAESQRAQEATQRLQRRTEAAGAQGRRWLRQTSGKDGAGLTEEQTIDARCQSLAAYRAHQQLLADLRSAPAASPPSASSASAAVAALTAASRHAHRYRLYTDQLISIGLQHEADMRRRWVELETQARAINRSAERAARRDVRESVREMMQATRAGRSMEAKDRAKEAQQHVDEANEARNSRAAIYCDASLYLPSTRQQERERKVSAALSGEQQAADDASSGSAAISRQPLFDPTPQVAEFSRRAEAGAARHSFRPESPPPDPATQAVYSLPPIVEQLRGAMDEEESRRRSERQQLLDARRRRLTEREQRARQLQRQPRPARATATRQPAAAAAAAAAGHRARAALSSAAASASSCRLPPPQFRRHVGGCGGATVDGGQHSALGRGPLYSQSEGDVMLADISLFTVNRRKAEEERKASERRQIAEEERRMREQWLDDERRDSEQAAADQQTRSAHSQQQQQQQQQGQQKQDGSREEGAAGVERRRSVSAAAALPAPHRLSTPPAAARSASFTVQSSSAQLQRRRSTTFMLRPPLPQPAARLQQKRGTVFILPARQLQQADLSSPLHEPASPSTPSHPPSASPSLLPPAQLRSRWQNAAGKAGKGKEHLARRFSLVAAADIAASSEAAADRAQPQPARSAAARPDLSALLPPSVLASTTSLVATNASHDPLHSAFLSAQRQQRRTGPAAVFETVKRWLEEQEECKQSIAPAAAEPGAASSSSAAARSSVAFTPEAVSPFSSLLLRPPYSPRTLRRHQGMRQQLPVSVSNSAVFSWMRKHAIVPRRPIDPSEEVKYRQVFNELDVDHSGLLDTGELLSALSATHGLQLSEAELRLLLCSMDIRYDGFLSFQQFVQQFASMDEWDSLFMLWTQRQRRRAAADDAATQRPQPRPASAAATRAAASSALSQPASSPAPSASAAAALTAAAGNSGSAVSSSDVLVPFLLWVPAFHRLQLLQSLMSLQLTPEEEAAIRAQAAADTQQQEAERHRPGSAAGGGAEREAAAGAGGDGSAAGLSLLDLWRVTRTQVRRKRLESEKAELLRIQQMQLVRDAATGFSGTERQRERRRGRKEQEEQQQQEQEIWRQLHEQRDRITQQRRSWWGDQKAAAATATPGDERPADAVGVSSAAVDSRAFELVKRAALTL